MSRSLGSPFAFHGDLAVPENYFEAWPFFLCLLRFYNFQLEITIFTLTCSDCSLCSQPELPETVSQL